MRLSIAGVVLAFCLSISALANADTVTITANSDVLAGRAGFVGAGTATAQFNWATAFPGGTVHTPGQLLPQVASITSLPVLAPGGTQNTVQAVAPSTLNLANWVDAPGFNGPGNSAIPDLALNNVESFDLVFQNGHRSVGFAIITGTSNAAPINFDLSGATFRFTAKNGNAVVGSADFSLASGRIDQAWLTITSDLPFNRLEVREIGATSAADQYFSNILTSENAVNVVPLPAACWAGLALFGGLRGAKLLRRRRIAAERDQLHDAGRSE